MIRTVIFDLGKVLVPFDFTTGYQQMSEQCGLAPDEIRRRLRADGLVREFETGLMDEHEFYHRVSGLLETEVPYEQFCDIWFSVFEPRTLVPEAMVAAIRQKYRTVLLSNTNPLHYSSLRQHYPILDHFDAYVLSHEVKAMKPSPKIYAAAIEAAQCAPGECFFTDDIPEFVEGAIQAGIDAVQFQSCEQITRELNARGVTW